jgi:heme O synthase-like polyprenyltransferase
MTPLDRLLRDLEVDYELAMERRRVRAQRKHQERMALVAAVVLFVAGCWLAGVGL